MDRRHVIVIVGNIGSGKTTLCRNLAETREHLTSVMEPVEEWKSKGILQAFYDDMKTYALPFQLYAFSSRLRFLKKKLKETTNDIIMDGHIFSDKFVFKESLKESGHIDPKQEVLYDTTFDDWMKLVPHGNPTMLIYLDTEPSVCMERLKKRGRNEETGIPLDYLVSLKNKFDKMYQEMKANDERGFVLHRIPGNMGEQDLLSQVGQLIDLHSSEEQRPWRTNSS